MTIDEQLKRVGELIDELKASPNEQSNDEFEEKNEEIKNLFRIIKLKLKKPKRIMGWVSVKDALPRKYMNFWCKAVENKKKKIHERVHQCIIELNEEGSTIMITHWFKFPFIWY